MRQQIICGIDVGNSNVKTVIAEIDRQTLRPRVLGFSMVESRGLRKGVVVDMAETINNVADSFKEAQAMAGVRINRAYASVSGFHIRTQISKGFIAVSRADNQISQSDIERVKETASVINLPPNREIIHVIPRNFIVDGQESVKSPLGMKGVRLEAEVFIVDGLSPHIHNVLKCINANDIEILDFVFSPLAASLSSLDKQQREHGVMNIDFGGGTSTFALYYEGELTHTAVLPVGSRHITNDLAVALRTTMDVAERVKCQFGNIGSADVSKKDNIDLSDIIGEQNFVIPRRQITKIIDARASELFEIISDEMKKIPVKYLLPAGAVFVGGGANIPGLIDFAKDTLKLPVRVSRDYPAFDGMTDSVSNPAFAVALGLILWGVKNEFSGGGRTPRPEFASSIGFFKKISYWLKNFLP